jgi:hypothetical protein
MARVSQIEASVKHHQSEEKAEEAAKYLKNIEDRFLLDAANSIYKPKSYKETGIRKRLKKFWRNFRKHWAMVIINAATFAAVVYYAHYARLQWNEMKKAADAANDSAAEAKRSRLRSETAFRATVGQFRLDQRAWMVPEFIFENLRCI